ncbi:MAG TPA: methyltransferase [Actinophytocola sp.]|uniref:class I SAM-dependent methyltransferase n=1 Tax=Actinophytocola sp. TaxID=1872138 RepID=UPI002DBA8BD2|nr:methyltransferase [Actinophytocola sp.]HEU5472555.1 methyltransferase [Actinophytocola sp.]
MAHSHTHDGIDWPGRLAAMRRSDELGAQAIGAVAERLVDLARDRGTGAARGVGGPDAGERSAGAGDADGADRDLVVVDVGSGAGGMSAALAAALVGRGGGGRVVLVDAVPELLEASAAHVEQVIGGSDQVEVSTVRVDAASEELPELISDADLVWASQVVHHLPDQRKGIEGLVRVLAPGGWLALGEGGLPMRCLPWDVGVGEPGLGDRLSAAQTAWFAEMRATMPGVTRLPVGWTRAIADAGLTEVSSFTYLIDHPAPPSELVKQSVVDWLAWYTGAALDRLGEADQIALARLLDPVDPAFVGARDDVFVLRAATVHLGRKTSG